MENLKAQVLATALAMNASGINRGSAGNVSARCEGGFVITPTGMAYAECVADDMVWLPLKDSSSPVGAGVQCRLSTADPLLRRKAVLCETPASPPPSQQRQASSEWRFHHDIYVAHPDAGAIVHTHSAFATALACHGLSIPAFHYMVARFGGDDVPCAAYATFGTQELSDAIIAALKDRCASLMAHHGMLVYGQNLKHALALAIELETLAEQYWRALQLGQPKLLPGDEMRRVLDKFAGYGQAK
ncbi:MAG: class II aldolase/adducin family protein [Rhodocyclaceae bacterium]|nr:class II aldolase/adducin family protein [Rhodocyclaceae bacterium]MBP6109400.1 class II aldolase/adducin family protein [Rhodocyclaceae bacterium]